MNDLILSASLPVATADRLGGLLASMRANLSPATWHALMMDTRAWRAWCEAAGQDAALPAAPQTLVAWLEHQETEPNPKTGKPVAVATIRRRLASLASLHKAAGLPNPGADMLVRLQMRGIARRRGTQQYQAPGFSGEDAAAVAGRLTADGKEARTKDVRDVALILAGRDLLARSGELVSLTREAVDFQSNGTARVRMLRGKTSTETNTEAQTYLIGPVAAKALKRWLDVSGITAGPLWRVVNKSGKVGQNVIAPREVTRILKAQAQRVDLEVDFTGHSLRVGMAKDLVADNAAMPAVMQVGGWSTPRMVARYTQDQDADNNAVAQYYTKRGSGKLRR